MRLLKQGSSIITIRFKSLNKEGTKLETAISPENEEILTHT